MTNEEFDASLVSAAFALGAVEGWRKISAAAAARYAGLDLARARVRFPARFSVLKRFGQLADAYALAGAVPPGTILEGSVKDRLFDLMLRRFDFLQTHRAGVVALLRTAPLAPGLGPFLACETQKSMGWLLEAAGVPSRGLRGELRKRGLAAVWAWGVRAWLRDESEDLSGTMAAVDVALTRADQVAARFNAAGSNAADADSEGFVPEADDAIFEPGAPEPGAPEPAAPEPEIIEPTTIKPGAIDDPPPPGVPPGGMPGI